MKRLGTGGNSQNREKQRNSNKIPGQRHTLDTFGLAEGLASSCQGSLSHREGLSVNQGLAGVDVSALPASVGRGRGALTNAALTAGAGPSLQSTQS